MPEITGSLARMHVVYMFKLPRALGSKRPKNKRIEHPPETENKWIENKPEMQLQNNAAVPQSAACALSQKADKPSVRCSFKTMLRCH
jgi:hypothetical protein